MKYPQSSLAVPRPLVPPLVSFQTTIGLFTAILGRDHELPQALHVVGNTGVVSSSSVVSNRVVIDSSHFATFHASRDFAFSSGTSNSSCKSADFHCGHALHDVPMHTAPFQTCLKKQEQPAHPLQLIVSLHQRPRKYTPPRYLPTLVPSRDVASWGCPIVDLCALLHLQTLRQYQATRLPGLPDTCVIKSDAVAGSAGGPPPSPGGNPPLCLFGSPNGASLMSSQLLVSFAASLSSPPTTRQARVARS